MLNKPIQQKKCKVCGTLFNRYDPFQKYCSVECYRTTISALKKLKCAKCHIVFDGVSHNGFTKKYCSTKCQSEDQSKKRMGKGNPAYRNGLRMSNKQKGKGYQNTKHLRACSKYSKEFVGKHGYKFCEICTVNQNGTPRFEVHHIYYASFYPRHKELHNQKNLILLCIGCHNDMHSGKMRSEVFKRLEEKRGLKELFK